MRKTATDCKRTWNAWWKQHRNHKRQINSDNTRYQLWPGDKSVRAIKLKVLLQGPQGVMDTLAINKIRTGRGANEHKKRLLFGKSLRTRHVWKCSSVYRARTRGHHLQFTTVNFFTRMISPLKFGYMVNRHSVIFSKLFDGRAVSCSTATAPPAARLPATRGCSAPTGAAATTGSGATAKGTPVSALIELIGTGVSGVELLLSGEGWYWGWIWGGGGGWGCSWAWGWACGWAWVWFCCCPGTLKRR